MASAAVNPQGRVCLSLMVALFALISGTGVRAGADTFVIEGRVYCDTCRAGFETSVTEYIEGAKVKLECRHEETKLVHDVIEGLTDASGSYRLEVVDDHQDEICEVTLVESPMSECSEIKESRNSARVLLTHNAGLATGTRFANSLGFLRKEPLPICGSILKQYMLGDEE